jgi:hypothetical protein
MDGLVLKKKKKMDGLNGGNRARLCSVRFHFQTHMDLSASPLGWV